MIDVVLLALALNVAPTCSAVSDANTERQAFWFDKEAFEGTASQEEAKRRLVRSVCKCGCQSVLRAVETRLAEGESGVCVVASISRDMLSPPFPLDDLSLLFKSELRSGTAVSLSVDQGVTRRRWLHEKMAIAVARAGAVVTSSDAEVKISASLVGIRQRQSYDMVIEFAREINTTSSQLSVAACAIDEEDGSFNTIALDRLVGLTAETPGWFLYLDSGLQVPLPAQVLRSQLSSRFSLYGPRADDGFVERQFQWADSYEVTREIMRDPNYVPDDFSVVKIRQSKQVRAAPIVMITSTVVALALSIASWTGFAETGGVGWLTSGILTGFGSIVCGLMIPVVLDKPGFWGFGRPTVDLH